MSEVMTRSRDMMFHFYKTSPELGVELQPLEGTETFEKISLLAELSKYLPETERARLAQLVALAIYSKQNATDGLKETEAAAYLARMFGAPDREILDKATPVFNGLIRNIEGANAQGERWLQEADFSLADLADEIERSIFPVMVIQIQALEDKKRRFEASRQSLEGQRDAGPTAQVEVDGLKEAHEEELAKMQKELEEAVGVYGLWFELAQSLRTQQLALHSAYIPDPMAVREEIVFSGSGGAVVQ